MADEELDPAKFLSAPGINTITRYWYVINGCKRKEEEDVRQLKDMQKLVMNILKNDGNKESSYLKNWDTNNLYGWAMSQKLPVNGFK